MSRRTPDDVVGAVLDGAEQCFRDLGMTATNVDDIVQASGVARATLYRHVGGRNDVVLALVQREIDRLRIELARRLGAGRPAVELLVDGMLHVLDFAGDSVVLGELLSDPTQLAVEVSEPAMESLATRLDEFLEPLFAGDVVGIRSDLDPPIAVEFLVRTIVSLLTLVPERRARPDDRRRYLRQTLVPVFFTDDVVGG